MADEKYIQFVANYDNWVAVKKLKIESSTQPVTIMEFLASLTISVDAKVEENLKKVVNLSKLDSALNELNLGKGDTSKALAEVSSRNISAVINEITALTNLQANEQKELTEFCKIYATKKALKACQVKADYSSVNIPGMKKGKKAKA